MNTLPQELIRDIISYVPEYGFIVSKELHKPLKDIRFSFYCDTPRFICIMDIARTTEMNIAMDIVRAYMKCVHLAKQKEEPVILPKQQNRKQNNTGRHKLPPSEEISSDEDESGSDSDSDEEIVGCPQDITIHNIPINQHMTSMYEFEPFEWAHNVFKNDKLKIFRLTFEGLFHTNHYEKALRVKFYGPIYNDKYVALTRSQKSFAKKYRIILRDVFGLLMAHKNNVIDPDTTKQEISHISKINNIPDLLNIVALLSRGIFYDTFIQVYYGSTTANICKELYADLMREKSKYKNMITNTHHYKMFGTLGCHLVNENDIKHDMTLHEHYLATLVHRNMGREPNEKILGISARLAEMIIRKYGYY